MTARHRGGLGAALGALLLATGCQTATPPLYYWGSYEPLIYLSYVKPDKATPELQVAKLEEDVQRAAAKNQAVPPGLHAQLGYAYLQLGQDGNAAKEFEKERYLYPESAPFMDRMLGKLTKPAAQ
jgi:hypothetical protein